MTPSAGADDVVSAHRALASLEDRWLPPARFDESTPAKRALGIGYRFGKWFALDLPQDHFLTVFAHEVFGHGARLREIDVGHIDYHFDAPIPYGAGGAVTSFAGDIAATRADALGIDTAGIEAQNVLADHIGYQALAAGALPYRDAWLYLESRLDGLRYIRSLSPRSGEGHDVRSFVRDFNDGCDPPACTPVDDATLKRRAYLILGDPMLAYAGYGWAVSYLVRGRADGPLPMIPLPRDLKYLPMVRFDMTPYGTAVTTEHLLVRDRRLTSVSIGIGDTGAAHAWDLGVIALDALTFARVHTDVTAHVWRQPSLDTPPDAQAMAAGGLAAATAHVRIASGGPAARASLLVQAGYKSDGFVRGEHLHRGPILRLGISLAPR